MQALDLYHISILIFSS